MTNKKYAPHAPDYPEPEPAPVVRAVDEDLDDDAAAVDDDAPGLTEAEYLERRHALEVRLARLAARLVASRRFPRWVYHASDAPRIVWSRAERDALGGGWQNTPVATPGDAAP